MTTHALRTASFSIAHRSTQTRPRLATRGGRLGVVGLAALVPTILATILMVLAASLIGPFIMFAIPLMLVFGCAIGPLHALLRGEL